MKNILILGAGMVAKPMMDYLFGFENYHITSATRTVSKAEHIIEGRKNATITQLVADDDRKLEQQIKKADIVISLLPYTFHVKTAKICLSYKIPLVTTSYVSSDMEKLDNEARSGNVLLLNEIGLDPGIDHMSAMRIIDQVHENGGKIRAFRSYCGGIPAPEDNDNPWGYKFSWSPRGVLMAGRNSAKYLKKGEVVSIEGPELFKNHWPIRVEDLELETYPNRNSLPYIELYGISETATMYRGTLRYPGWSRTMLAISELGLLEERQLNNSAGFTNFQMMQLMLGLRSEQDPKKFIIERLQIDEEHEIIQKFKWLGLFDQNDFVKEEVTPIDFLSDLMVDKMKYDPDEKDMIVLYHDFLAEFKDKHQHITSTLIDTGVVGKDSAMSRTVSLPAAIAVRLILEGKIRETGVRIPVDKEIYHPVLQELERLDIICKEKYQDVEFSGDTVSGNKL